MSHYYKKLLEKLTDQTISPEELEQLLIWLNRKEEFKDAEILEQKWLDLENAEAIDQKKALNIRTKLSNKIRKEQTTKSGKVRKFGSWWPKVAASLAFLLISGLGLMYYLNSPVVIKSDFGEIVEIKLPDNTLVRLNANSEISYSRRWTSQEVRTVSLKGEAWFEVRKDLKSHKKFVVHTRDLNVEVLGTEFNVNTRNIATRVYLEEGSVKLRALDKNDSLMMVPGEEAGFDHKGSLSSSSSPVPRSAGNWKEGSMILKDVKLTQIFKEYENVFGVSYTVSDSELLNQKFTVIFPITDKRKAMDIIQDLVQVPLKIKTTNH
ncbi:FecR domain-containing protein [Membranicola marinus]|uniref:FecR domain-containing protein n=1 Tax=Membranihabitans marinus TaxID=1227546 RepID=A0A953HR47_9BACT|nr:FecR domain-containing protein [Membranihabitans marinus]MBY5956766.1 FecR domain-containing protein [Membranihabitans marinus]